MTVRDLLECSLSEVMITTKEDPRREKPEIMVCSQSDADEEEFLSEKVLNSEINLIEVRDDCIFISLKWYRERCCES